MNKNPVQFAVQSRILHWLMAAMLLTMLFIGVAMVASVGDYHKLVALHRPLGIAILILAIVRLINRRLTTLPPFPPTMSQRERKIASASEKLLYTLMIALPLVGWGMLSAGRYPIVMFGPAHLPAILPANPALYAVLRKTHTVLAYLLFLTFLAHLTAVLFHTLVIRDGLLNRMALWPVRPAKTNADPNPKSNDPEPIKNMNTTGIIDLECKRSVAETAERLESMLKSKGMKIFARIDQVAEATAVGLEMRPMVLFIFGNPQAGTPLMIAHPSLAMDLPLKALVWEAADGKVLLSYNSPEFLQQRHGLPAPPFVPVENILKAAATA
jgi:cytochrome b561/uncharacterized protein (DUF302 family)